MDPAYKIAVLGFGSLPNHIHSDIYNKTLEVVKPQNQQTMPSGANLKPDSPFIPANLKLPLRLGRLSGEGTDKRRFTMVLFPGASDETVYFAKSKFSNLDSALRNLREREGISESNYETIGYVNLLNGKMRARIPAVAEKVKNWASENGFNAVIWTDLPPKGVEFPGSSTGREIEPLLSGDPVLLLNTKKYIADLASSPNPLQQRILNMPIDQQPAAQQNPVPAAAIDSDAYKASLIGDFDERAKPENQTDTPRHAWYRSAHNGDDWGPFAAEYPKPAVPAGVDPAQWKRDRVIQAALYWVKKGVPYSSKTAYRVEQTLPGGITPRFMLRGHFPARNCGLDCSNFASWVYNFGLGIQFSSAVDDLAYVKRDHNGAMIPDENGKPIINRYTKQAGNVIKPGEPLKKGDLLLFSGSPKHVVIYMDENHVIESTSAGQGVARVVDIREPQYSYLRPKASNERYLFARRPIG